MHNHTQPAPRIPLLRSRVLSLLILAASAAWIWASQPAPGSIVQGGIPAPREGFLAPDFTLPSSTGEPIHLADLRGQPVLINLWASWCPPCKAEMPAIQRVYERYHEQGFEVLAINTAFQDARADADRFVLEAGLTFPILYDLDGATAKQYHLRALPTSFFVAPDGKIQTVVVGGPLSEALLLSKVEALLAEGR